MGKITGGSAYDGATAVALDTEDNIFVFGHTLSQNVDISSPLGNADAWLAKLNGEGELLQEFTYGGTAFDLGKTSPLTMSSNYGCVGTVRRH